jgi:translation initiation factor IF-2
MADTKDPGEKTLRVTPSKTLGLKREQGVVRQSFSHGRSKAVVVEKVKRRVIGPAGEPKTDGASARTAKATPAEAPATVKAAPKPQSTADVTALRPSGVVLRTLTEEERSARAHALADARVREAEERKIAEEEARRRAGRDAVESAQTR